MTPTEAMTHLRRSIEEHRRSFDVRIRSPGVFLTRGTYPWDIGLKLEVDNSEQREIITQKIIAYVNIHPTELSLRKDDAGHAYFYESQGYRFHDERGIPTGRDEYPDHAAYRYVLVKEEAQPAPAEPPQPVPKTEPQPLLAPQPMTPEAALAHLRQWVREQKKEQGIAFGVTVYSGGPVSFERRRYPWEVGLRLIVDKPEQFDVIKQKIEEHGAAYSTELVVKKDAEGHAYFYEEQGYRFFDADGFPSSCNEYPQHGDYRFVLIQEAIPLPQPIADEPPPQPQTEAPVDQPPETADPAAFQQAQRCPITQCLARIWGCVSQAFARLIRCLCCQGKKPATSA